MVALSDAINRGVIPNSEIVLVLSDKAEAKGLTTASERGLKTLAIERRGRKRDEHETEIVAARKAGAGRRKQQ